MGICSSRRDPNQLTNANINYRSYTNNNDVQEVKQLDQPVSYQPQQFQSSYQNQQVDEVLYAKQIQNPVAKWNQQQPQGDQLIDNNGAVVEDDAEIARRQELMLRENLAGDSTGKPGQGILEMIQDSFNRLNKIIDLLGPTYTKMPADDAKEQ